MKLLDLHLSIVYVNLAYRQDRRAEIEYQLAINGLIAIRQPGVLAETVRDPWGFQNERRYACSLAKRLAIRRGMCTGAEAVLLLEDDVTFHPDFRKRMAKIELPEVWGIIFLGCWHVSKPTIVAEGLVKCTKTITNHAMIVHRNYYHKVLEGLRGAHRGANREIEYSDAKLASRQDEIPSYSVYPNLAWQYRSHSNTAKRIVQYYRSDGRQKGNSRMLRQLDIEMSRNHSGR